MRSMTKRAQDTKSAGGVTAAALFAVAGLHVMWALGSAFPFRSRDDLADSVIGTREVPSSAACLAVASALVISATLVAGVVPMPSRIRTFALRMIAATLTTRGVAGSLGQTSLFSPGSDSPAFKRWDKRIYAPLCLWLASGVRRSI